MAETQVNLRNMPLGEVLVHLGVITAEQLKDVLPEVAPDQHDIAGILVARGLATEERILKAVSARHRVPYFATFEGLLDPSVSKLVPEKICRRSLVVPIAMTEKGLLLGMVNALDLNTLDWVAALVKVPVHPVLTTRKNLFDAINLQYPGKARPAAAKEKEGGAAAPGKPKPRKDTSSIKIVPRDMSNIAGVGQSRLRAEDVSVIDTVDSIVAEAVQMVASDVHLEPTPDAFKSRFRVDGILQAGSTYPKDMEPALVARIKILARLDITETRLPQDGHISVDYGGRSVDLRVSTLPTIHGEKVVIRVLDQARSRAGLRDLGMPADVQSSFDRTLRRPMGMILVNGPTGSGKTTTLYAAIKEIASLEKNIVTLEDPVEYRLADINQVETNARVGLTFANGLRAILRQDPNVILVGEIRDEETAQIAISASITGHMVLSTLHTKDAAGTITRLINMGVEPFLLSAALSGVLAQRLVRVLCSKCKKEQSPTADELSRIGAQVRMGSPFFAAVGCDACFNLGYRGRMGIYEWLPITRVIRSLISSKADVDQIRAAAREQGMRTLQEEALNKVYDGLTSLAEVVRITHEEEPEEETKPGEPPPAKAA